MPIHRVVGSATLAFAFLLPVASVAQAPSQPQISLQYHEVLPPGADTAPVFIQIFDRLQKDCEAIGKAFNRKCVISQTNVNTNVNYGGDMTGTRNLNANATIILLPGPAEASPPTAPSR